MKKAKVIPMARINTRVRQEQHLYIKERAKELTCTEGEVFRAIVDRDMKINLKRK